MEVETQSLASFTYSIDKMDISLDFPPPDFLPEVTLNSDILDSPPETSDRKCEGFQMPELIDEGRDDGMHTTKSSEFAAVKLQKVYRSYRTRRRLADSAVVAEELWWLLIDYARLNHSTISFFDFFKPETAASRWNRISLNASKVGKGLSKDAKAQKLAFQHWIEAIDPRHRYGHSLHLYYDEWCKTNSGQPFFYWLDIGDGKEVDLKECPRSKLRQQCIKYLGPQEREHYEYVISEGKITHKQTGNLLDTSNGPKGAKWIFVTSTSKRLYAGEKKKGIFHHSSFLAGGATLAAGRLIAENGILKVNNFFYYPAKGTGICISLDAERTQSISPYSGHYRPTEDSFDIFLSFLQDSGVNLDEVQKNKASEDSDIYDDVKFNATEMKIEVSSTVEPAKLETLKEEKDSTLGSSENTETGTTGEYKRTLSGGLQSPRAQVPKKSILQRINSKKAAQSYQLGHQLTVKWTTGAGPRIGCVADYPVELRVQALEFVNLSPRTPPTPASYKRIADIAPPALEISNGNRISPY